MQQSVDSLAIGDDGDERERDGREKMFENVVFVTVLFTKSQEQSADSTCFQDSITRRP